jgi:hypothetical protein
MKKIILTIVLLVTVSVSFGQVKWQQDKIDQFVDAAVKEYKLDDSQKETLNTSRTTMFMGYLDLQKKRKSGELSQEEGKSISKKLASDFHNALIKLTGKSYKELKPFLQRMRKELK